METLLCLLWVAAFGCSAQAPPGAAEVELLDSVKQKHVGWTSSPLNEWDLTTYMTVNSESYPVFQGCLSIDKQRMLWSPLVPRVDTHHVLLDVQFAVQQEPSGQVRPLAVHLASRRPGERKINREVLSLRTPNPFTGLVLHSQIESYVTRNRSLDLGSVVGSAFRLGFSYSGTCAFVVSARLYYRRCPGLVVGLARFAGAFAGSEEAQLGSCVDGANSTLLFHPKAHCLEDGVWGQLTGECVCDPGHERVGDSCAVCRLGYYKAANESGGCRVCPPNSVTWQEGAEKCECLDGYDRLPSDPQHQGCTRQPSSPMNLLLQHHSNALVSVRWEPPLDLGGRAAVEVTYSVACSQKEAGGWRWEPCQEDVVFLPSSAGLTGMEVNITGLRGPYDYRLSFRASNALGGSSAEATVNVHGRHVQVMVTPETRSTGHPAEASAAPLEDSSTVWWVAKGLLGGGLLLALTLAVGCSLRRALTKPTGEQELELVPWNPTTTFSILGAPPQSSPEPGRVAVREFQSLGAHEHPLLANLRDTLVERSRLTLGKELGKGEFGSVFEAVLAPEQEGDDGFKVAVKTIKGIHSQEDLHEFIKEAELMKSFDHDNVVRLLGVALEREEDSALPVPLVILPFMKHGDLRRFLIATRYGDVPIFVPHQSLLRFMFDITAGMEYLSSQGFLHRDLAARNCMLGDSLRVCVADFGLSKQMTTSNYYRQTAVKPVPIKWMAIESLSESIYTTKSDVWAFGVTAWEIVSRGRTPYPGVHNHDLLDLLTSGQRLKQPQDCDAKLYELMQACWHQDPAQRPGFAELGSRLKALLSRLPPLDAYQESLYINQGLEAAAAADPCGASSPGCGDEEETGAAGNKYTLAPSLLAAQRNDEEESGYLLSNSVCSAGQGDQECSSVSK